MENYNKDLEMDPTKQETSTDPLQEWREDKSAPSGVSKKDLEGNMPDEEEQDRVKEHLPERNKYINIEDVTADDWEEEQGLDESLLNFLYEEGVSVEMLDRFQELEDFEEKDKEEELEDEAVHMYSPKQFRLMERCVNYQNSLDVLKTMESKRPMLEGQPMTDEQVGQFVSVYRESESKKSWGSFTPEKIDFIKKCVAWDQYHQKALRLEKNQPTYSDGRLIPSADIEKMAFDYRDLKRENPDEIASMKFESGEWKKENLVWQENMHDGMKQWSAFKDDEYSEDSVKYITNQQPADGSGDFYFKVRNTHHINTRDGSNKELVFIDIKYPTREDIEGGYSFKKKMMTREQKESA